MSAYDAKLFETTNLKTKTAETFQEMMDYRGMKFSENNDKNSLFDYMGSDDKDSGWFEYVGKSDTMALTAVKFSLDKRQTQVISFRQKITEKVNELKERGDIGPKDKITIIMVMSEKPIIHLGFCKKGAGFNPSKS